jgi:hypothetical protein
MANICRASHKQIPLSDGQTEEKRKMGMQLVRDGDGRD